MKDINGWCGVYADQLCLWTVRATAKECWETIRKFRLGKSKEFLEGSGWRVVRVTVIVR